MQTFLSAISLAFCSLSLSMHTATAASIPAKVEIFNFQSVRIDGVMSTGFLIAPSIVRRQLEAPGHPEETSPVDNWAYALVVKEIKDTYKVPDIVLAPAAICSNNIEIISGSIVIDSRNRVMTIDLSVKLDKAIRPFPGNGHFQMNRADFNLWQGSSKPGAH